MPVMVSWECKRLKLNELMPVMSKVFTAPKDSEIRSCILTEREQVPKLTLQALSGECE